MDLTIAITVALTMMGIIVLGLIGKHVAEFVVEALTSTLHPDEDTVEARARYTDYERSKDV